MTHNCGSREPQANCNSSGVVGKLLSRAVDTCRVSATPGPIGLLPGKKRVRDRRHLLSPFHRHLVRRNRFVQSRAIADGEAPLGHRKWRLTGFFGDNFTTSLCRSHTFLTNVLANRHVGTWFYCRLSDSPLPRYSFSKPQKCSPLRMTRAKLQPVTCRV